MKRNTILLALTGIALAGSVKAQTQATHDLTVIVPTIMIMDIEGTTPISLSSDITNLEPGVGLPDMTNNSLWLNYTYIKSADTKRAKIVASITNTLNTSYDIKLLVASATGSGGGTLGTPTSATAITLSTSPIDIITGINSSYTGDGENNGHRLTYTAVPKATFQNIIAGTSSAATVTYTISEP